jgi:hypothetical protein
MIRSSSESICLLVSMSGVSIVLRAAMASVRRIS